MAEKNVSLFKGLVTVLIVAVIVFFAIFFFFPDTSYKYFGTAFDKEKAVENMFASLVLDADYMTQEESEKVSSYLSSADGKAFIRNIASAVTSGKEALGNFVTSDSFREFQKTMGECLSKESLEKLSDAVNATAESLLSSLD